MQNLLRRGLFIGLLGVLSSAPAIGQPNVGQPGRQTTIRTGGAEAPPGPLVTVRFAGGSLKDYIGAVQKAAAPADVNVVPPPEAGQVQLPEIALKGVTVKSALEAVQWAALDSSGFPAYQVYVNVNEGDASPVYAVIRTNNPANPINLEARRRALEHGQQQIEVFSIRELIESRPAAEGDQANAGRANLLSAIETALRMQQDDGQQPPEMKLHQETSLLIVRGTQDQINIVKSVLSRMRDDAERRGASSRSSASRERERAGKIRKLTANIDLQRKELEFRQKRASRQREIAEKGQGSVEDAAMAELETARAQTMLAQMMQELEDVQKESSPESAGGQRGDFKMVVHDLSGLTEVSAQILSLAKAIVEPEGGWAVLEDNTLKVGAPEVQQRLVQALFRTIRGKGDSPTQVKAKP